MKNLIFGLLVLAVPTQVVADEELGTLVNQQPQGRYLPSGTEVVIRMNSSITTRSNSAQVGDKFYLTVVYDVMRDGRVVIPKGAGAVGEVTWRTGKAVFGKSGKMDVEIRHVEVNGNRVPLKGKFRQEGEGNTAAVVGAVAATLVLGPGLLITGKSATIPAGREFIVTTAEPLLLEDVPPKQIAPSQSVVEAASLEDAKSACTELGFASGTEKHADCVLQLVK